MSTDTEWMRQAACNGHDSNLWFPEAGKSTRAARVICATCPVKAECTDFAVESDVWHGVWGGLDGYEVRKLRKERLRAGTLRRTCDNCRERFTPRAINQVLCSEACQRASNTRRQARWEEARRINRRVVA